jgi:hypothetical protein
MGKKSNAYEVLVGEPEGKIYKKDLDLCEFIILKWILAIIDGVVWTGSIGLRMGTSGSSCEHANDRSDSTKCWDVVELHGVN